MCFVARARLHLSQMSVQLPQIISRAFEETPGCEGIVRDRPDCFRPDYGSLEPALDLSELKPGDALIIASTAGADPNKVTAITLLAGVEPILTSAPKGRQGMVLGNWNLDMGGGMGLPQ